MAPSKKAGRPRRTDEPVRVVYRLPRDVRDELRQRAALEGRTMGAIIAIALRQYFKRMGEKA